MKCIDCILFVAAEETGDEPGCASGGDVSNPNTDIYCAEIDGKDGDRTEWEEKQYREE